MVKREHSVNWSIGDTVEAVAFDEAFKQALIGVAFLAHALQVRLLITLALLPEY